MTKLEAPFVRLLDQLEPPVTVIMADTFLFWVVGVGNQRNISVASFWPMSPSMFTIIQHVDLLVQNSHFPAESGEYKFFLLISPPPPTAFFFFYFFNK